MPTCRLAGLGNHPLDLAHVQRTGGTGAEIERAEAALIASADATRRPLLVQAHQAWLAYRQEQCKLEFDTTRTIQNRDSVGGTKAPMLEQKCQLRLNDARLLELRAVAARS